MSIIYYGVYFRFLLFSFSFLFCGGGGGVLVLYIYILKYDNAQRTVYSLVILKTYDILLKLQILMYKGYTQALYVTFFLSTSC